MNPAIDVEVDFGAAMAADPYPTYRWLRQHRPVARWAGSDVWLVSRHDDVAELLGHPAARAQPEGEPVPDVYIGGPAEVMWRNNMALLDEPDHTRVRRSIARPIGPLGAGAMASTIDRIVDDAVGECVDDAVDECVDDAVDAVARLAVAVPRRVVQFLLGIDDREFATLAAITPDFLRLFAPEANGPEDVERVHLACASFIDFFSGLVARRRAEPLDDVTSQAVRAADDGRLNDDELVATLRGVFTAGFETTVASIAAFVWCAAENPMLLADIRRDPARARDAVDETLRWESPVQFVTRTYAEPIDVAGVTIPVGARVRLLLGSANHDPDRFDDPDEFVLGRDATAQVAFGGGRHQCAGAAVARTELESVIRTLAERVESIDLIGGPPRRHPNVQFRSLQQLRVRMTPTTRRSRAPRPPNQEQTS